MILGGVLVLVPRGKDKSTKVQRSQRNDFVHSVARSTLEFGDGPLDDRKAIFILSCALVGARLVPGGSGLGGRVPGLLSGPDLSGDDHVREVRLREPVGDGVGAAVHIGYLPPSNGIPVGSHRIGRRLAQKPGENPQQLHIPGLGPKKSSLP